MIYRIFVLGCLKVVLVDQHNNSNNLLMELFHAVCNSEEEFQKLKIKLNQEVFDSQLGLGVFQNCRKYVV